MASLRRGGSGPGKKNDQAVEKACRLRSHSNPQRTEDRTLQAFARCGLPDSLFEQLESLEKLRQAELKLRTLLELESFRLASAKLQHIHRRIIRLILGTALVIPGADRNVPCDVDDLFFFVHPDDIERDLRVLHPK